MWAIVSCLCCVIKWFLYRVDAPFPLLLGDVLSVFCLFWCPLASCIVLGFLLGSGPFVINSYLSKKKKNLRV